MDSKFPFDHHPCWAGSRNDLWERIHLPVARTCNVKCLFCDHQAQFNCGTSKPGSSSWIMTPDEAMIILRRELMNRPRLKIVGISGPGDPLNNPESFEVMQLVHEMHQNLKLCLCTNGVLLSERLANLDKLGVGVISVSISTASPVTAQNIYEWANVNGKLLRGSEMGRTIVEKQMKGISEAVEVGIKVKVNTILIPKINENEMEELSQILAALGASIQNIVPLVPWAKMKSLSPPTREALLEAREKGSKYIEQFHHCHQCRSDVVGIPGQDSILTHL